MLVGRCDPAAPAGVVGGMTTIFVMPANPPAVAPWHSTQVVAPAWFILDPENFAPLRTGGIGTLEPAPTWQFSHGWLVGMWLGASPRIEKFAAGIAKE